MILVNICSANFMNYPLVGPESGIRTLIGPVRIRNAGFFNHIMFSTLYSEKTGPLKNSQSLLNPLNPARMKTRGFNNPFYVRFFLHKTDR